jgi:stalled ribosome rescue protein Dom34
MTASKRVGIWMDHSSANIMAFTSEGPIETATIESPFTHEQKEQSLRRSEKLMNNKEQQEAAAYYKNLGEVIKGYDEVILFGPTDAKAELFNLLKADHHFENIKIEVKQADKLTENQQHAFVKDYFSRQWLSGF